MLQEGRALYLREKRRNASVAAERAAREKDVSELLQTALELQVCRPCILTNLVG